MWPFRTRSVGYLAVLLGAAVLVMSADARASTVFAHVEDSGHGFYGPVRFVAGPGEQNRLRVRSELARGEYVFHDAGSRLRAQGQCWSVDRHTAICPIERDGPTILLGGGNDRVWLEGGTKRGGTARGGAGDDRLTGGRDGSGAELYGDAGNDVLRGGDARDDLHGGPGRDRLFGGDEDDRLYDDETDAQAAPDFFDGGPEDHGDEITFARRQKPLRIALGRDIRATRDSFVDVENVIGGSGSDRLTGDAGPNVLDGGDGADVVRGGGGADSVRGGPGNDRVFGGPGPDNVSGDAGTNQLYGDAGDDVLDGDTRIDESPSAPAGTSAPDALDCGDGADKALGDPSDTLTPACEEYWPSAGPSWFLRSVPELRDDHADFVLRCPYSCAGTLTLRSLFGAEYGTVGFDVAVETPPITVSVPLSASGVAVLRDGTVVQIEIRIAWAPAFPWGYRVFLRLG